MKPHGGKRDGAGRKPIQQSKKRITRSVNLERDAWDKLSAKATKEGISVSELVNRWAKRIK